MLPLKIFLLITLSTLTYCDLINHKLEPYILYYSLQTKDFRDDCPESFMVPVLDTQKSDLVCQSSTLPPKPYQRYYETKSTLRDRKDAVFYQYEWKRDRSSPNSNFKLKFWFSFLHGVALSEELILDYVNVIV